MCSQYKVQKEKLEDLFKELGIADDFEFEYERIFPHKKAPVILADSAKLFNFSLIPSWSKERRPKSATYNARIETILEKPTWKKPFLTNHCVVPITTFFEPVYEGEYSGNMVAFKSNEILLAAGIWDSWIDKMTGETIDSFSILTSEPSDFVRKIGHDRQPIFLAKDAISDWINFKTLQPEEMVDLVLGLSKEPKLTVEIDRKLKSVK